nr:NADH-cytochrome b5 reductase-like isoform X1 [Taeniopygia guttata]XP_041573811.1 NADH-cytochrome b5 reductase-like isoform X1 [Taeniopygia guttata]XP_041573812.1 NADH-cytochrome b5 reductase-like isoform X1 [Taeniopygia guttata]
MSDNEEDWLALRPQEPSPSQCCGSGCKPCIYDVYEKELAQWERAKAMQDKSLLMGKKEQSNNSELNPDTFTAFSVSSVEQLTEDTYQYKFELPGNSSLQLSLGQHIVLRVEQQEPPERPKSQGFPVSLLRGVVNGLEVQRAYTPISPRNAEGYFEVLIKCYEAGLMSQYIKTWKRGDVVFWRGPFGGFPYQPNKHGELLMLASGTGLAPMIPILQSITDDEEDETFVTLVGCFPTFDKIYLKPLLQDLARYWNIRIFYVLSQETSLEKLPWSYQENTYTGRLNEDLMKTIVNSCRRKPFVLICGSSAFNEDMSRYLKAVGIEENSCFVF